MRKVSFLVILVALLAVVPAALAGGWATVSFGEMPGEIRAGEPWSVELTVWQHGVTPVHDLGDDVPIEPTFVGTNAETGERVEAVAWPVEEAGRFVLEVTLPSEGQWEWTIYPAPLAGEVQYKPLTVLPPLPAAAPESATPLAAAGAPWPVVLGIVALVIALGLVPWLVTRRDARPRVGVE